MLCRNSLLLLLSTTTGLTWGWMVTPLRLPLSPPQTTTTRTLAPRFFMAPQDDDDVTDKIERTSFDQAGASLIEEEDQKRMEQMGDFDSNDSYQKDSMEALRAKIKERTQNLGIEKSKVTADYIASREKAAMEAGPPGGQQDANMFGGLDLSQISQVKEAARSDWDESMPTMFYDPEAELSQEEQEEADPTMLKNPIEQAWTELSESKWPDPLAALREVAVMFLVIGLSCLIVTSWDTVLRNLYTGFGFIPTKEDIANYASRFDGLDLPDGWTTGMTDVDVTSYGDTINAKVGSAMSDIGSAASSAMPDVGSAASNGIPEL